MALLLHRCRLGVALRDDQPPERAAILARDVLPGRKAFVIAEPDDPSRLGLCEEDAPSILGHSHVVELGPSLSVDADGRTQIHILGLEPLGPHVVPPVEKARLPLLQRTLEPPILRQVDVVRNPLEIVDARHHALLRSNSARSPVPYTRSAPRGPTAFGR